MNILVNVLLDCGKEEEYKIWFDDYNDEEKQFEIYAKRALNMISNNIGLQIGKTEIIYINSQKIQRLRIY